MYCLVFMSVWMAALPASQLAALPSLLPYENVSVFGEMSERTE